MDIDSLRGLGLSPLLAFVLIVAEDLLFLRVNRDHRLLCSQRFADLIVDVLKLSIAIRMAAPLVGLPIALKAVAHLSQQLRHLFMADRMALGREFHGEHSGALARPA